MYITKLKKAYNKKHCVLNNLSLSFERAEINGIIGANGSGKTTLFNCIYGIDNDYEGEIEMGDKKGARYNIGYLPAELFFYPRTTGKEYLEFCAKARKVLSPNIYKWNQLFELPLEHYAEHYSTGMKRKLGLMGLLLMDYEVLLLDEPFNGLDLATNMLLKEVLIKMKEGGKTIVICSHSLSLLTDISNKIYFLHKGAIEKVYSRKDFTHIEKELLAIVLKDKVSLIEGLVPILPSE